MPCHSRVWLHQNHPVLQCDGKKNKTRGHLNLAASARHLSSPGVDRSAAAVDWRRNRRCQCCHLPNTSRSAPSTRQMATLFPPIVAAGVATRGDDKIFAPSSDAAPALLRNRNIDAIMCHNWFCRRIPGRIIFNFRRGSLRRGLFLDSR